MPSCLSGSPGTEVGPESSAAHTKFDCFGFARRTQGLCAREFVKCPNQNLSRFCGRNTPSCFADGTRASADFAPQLSASMRTSRTGPRILRYSEGLDTLLSDRLLRRDRVISLGRDPYASVSQRPLSATYVVLLHLTLTSQLRLAPDLSFAPSPSEIDYRGCSHTPSQILIF